MKERFENPISVSEYITLVNEILKKVKVKIVGEIGQLKIHSPSGHVYFTLKDKDGKAIINCVIWRSVYGMFGFQLKEGMEVILSGFSDVYPARGSLTFKVESFEPVGEGALKRAYDELKSKLEKEGIFAEERKRPIPEYPQNIGVITSLRSGTVIHDFINNLGKFGFKVKAMDSRVEGQEAVKELISGIRSFRKEKIEVLVIIRGGGSLESLIAFDNEVLVREIVTFPVPVVAGIGHHKDVTLASLAADAAESTPSAAAQLLNRSWEKAHHKLETGEYRIIQEFQSLIQLSRNRIELSLNFITKAFATIFQEYSKAEKKVRAGIFKMEYQISGTKKVFTEKYESIAKMFQLLKQNSMEKILALERIIFHNNPERQLNLGYSIVRSGKKVIKSISTLKKGDQLEVQFFDGIVDSEIKKITIKK